MTAELSDPAGLALLFVASVAAGGINAIAGGGTILTFAVLSAILPPGPGRLVSANVTSTIGLWPGAVAATWATRHEWTRLPRWARWLVLPSVIGAVAGVAMLGLLPAATFDAVVPWLILLAAVLFTIQPQVARLVAHRSQCENESSKPLAAARGQRDVGQSRSAMPAGATPRSPDRRQGLSCAGAEASGRVLLACGLQLVVGIYGGYFGAGIGVLMLAILGLLGLGDIHSLNAIKNLLGTAINGVAAAVFGAAAVAGVFEVSWPCVAVAAPGAVIGAIAVARIARRLPATAVRRLVAILAFALSAYHLWREWA